MKDLKVSGEPSHVYKQLFWTKSIGHNDRNMRKIEK